MAKLKATFEFDAPRGAARKDLRQYIKYALNAWGGERHPEDPLFNGIDAKFLTIEATSKE